MEVYLRKDVEKIGLAGEIINVGDGFARNFLIPQGFAEKLNTISITLKRKMHDDGQLYGAINASEVVDALANQGISITKSQVEFEKSIKSKGMFKVSIKLTTRLKSAITVTIIAE